MTEQKLFYIVFSTLLVYGLSSFLQLGSFVLPLPFFEIGLLLVCIFLTFRLWKENKLAAFSLLGFGISQFLSLNYTYSFFLDDQHLETLAMSPVTDLFKIASQIILVIVLFSQNRLEPVFQNKNQLILFSAALLATLFLPQTYFQLLPLLFLVILLVIREKQFSHAWSLWLYLLLFAASREATFAFL